ncbi:hypothetical protein PHJA_001863000 [Phtheirospermum japonicum]|uniref:S-protein homolog n=1 Tax=Phtheirospermum japonicum TaxID=374723 RepID=A0A830CDQ8_9LAMI|nr:hypothetical protein PHJA_001863000 [Phtheirospermum japonicum]
MKIHCASADVEVGYHNLTRSEDFYWYTCMNLWKTTMFFCHFWWGNKDAAFEVYNDKITASCGKQRGCLWIARAPGLSLVDTDTHQDVSFYPWRLK